MQKTALNLDNSIESYDSKLRCRYFWDTLCSKIIMGSRLPVRSQSIVTPGFQTGHRPKIEQPP